MEGTEASRASSTELAYIRALSRDSVVEAYSGWTAATEAEQACIDIAFSAGDKVLDLGCGAGRFAARVGTKAGAYMGVDASPEMIDVARKNYPDLQFVVGDIAHFMSTTSQWDLVLLMGNVLDCLHPESRRGNVMRSCHDVLKDGGLLIGSSHLSSPGEPRGYYVEDYHGAEIENFRSSLAEIVGEVESYGFEVVAAMRDYRKPVADWCYWVARRRA